MKKNQKGFGVVEGLIILAVLVVLGLVGWKVISDKHPSKDQASTAVISDKHPSKDQASATYIKWSSDVSGNWFPVGGTPPSCPAQPILKSPTDLTNVTSILYPGQTRGGDYKPHGGFRFDTSKDNIETVTAPIDGYVYDGARYLVNGELQYYFDIINPCGVMVRLGHLLTLTSKYQSVANQFPAAKENDSRSTTVDSTVMVKTGEIIATRVGVTVGGSNTFFDFGVYDLRTVNQKGKDTSYVQQHGLWQAGHAVCWLKSWLPSADETKINSLPGADATSGKNSDYCS
jgi:hypothetical protein